MQETQETMGSISGSERKRGRGHDNPAKYSCQENLMDRGPWWATVHRVSESDKTEATEGAQGHSLNGTPRAVFA